MTLRDIYYYLVAFAMMAGILIVDLLNLSIDQKQNGRICVKVGGSGNFQTIPENKN